MEEPDEDFIGLANRYGEKRARRIWELSRIATRDFVDVIRRLDIRCHLAEPDSGLLRADRRRRGEAR